MRHELFIDNKKVDLSPNTNINLTYKSNLLSELDKITSSYSYTIKLPKTKRNMELIEGCNIPSNNSSFAYLNHRARLLRDGIEIVRDAVVVLLSVGSDIEISLTWGNVSALATFLSSDETLKDLDLGNITWTTAITAQTPKADYGNNSAFYQPVVKSNTIISKILQKHNIQISKPSNALYDKLSVPCISAIGVPGEIVSDKIHLSLFGGIGNDYDVYVFFSAEPQGNDYFDMKEFEFVERRYSGFNLKNKDLSVRIRGKIISGNGYKKLGGSIPAEDKNKILRITGLYNEVRIPYTSATYNSGTATWEYTFDVDVLIKGSDINGEFIELFLSRSYSTELWQTPLTVDLDIIPVDDTETDVTPEQGDVDYNLSANIPDISQIDFLKGIMSMMGWYAEPMEGDSGIRMLPYSTITDNKSKAVDWSEKIVNRRIEPSEIEFRMSDMAQKNYFRYAEDETVTGDYDGYITVDDRTLEARRDAVTLPFAATDTVNNMPSIPLYSYDDKGEMKINNSLTPRILIQEGTTLKFDGLQWNKLINDNWQVYQEIIRRPKIITEQVRLNAIDLKQIDMTIPVYISQYGSYFAILEIKTKDDDICDVQLLKI